MAWVQTLVTGLLVAMMFAAATPAQAQAVCKKKANGYFKLVIASAAPAVTGFEGIATPFTQSLGDPERGRLIVAHAEKGNCLACHQIPQLREEKNQGDLGPSLERVGSRYTEAQLRQLVANTRAVIANTIMPSYYSAEGLNRVQASHQGKTILSAQEVEDVVAFLKMMK